MSDSNVSEFFDSYAHDFDAIYGNNGCPVRRCGANQGVVPLPQPSR